MTPKLLFFDIDGTLLDYTGKMPASAKEALRQASLVGHRLVICSGRSGHQLSDWMFTDFDGIINCTGARVIFRQNVIYEHFVPWLGRCQKSKRGAGGDKWRSGGTDRGMHNPFTGKQYTWRGACYSDG